MFGLDFKDRDQLKGVQLFDDRGMKHTSFASIAQLEKKTPGHRVSHKQVRNYVVLIFSRVGEALGCSSW